MQRWCNVISVNTKHLYTICTASQQCTNVFQMFCVFWLVPRGNELTFITEWVVCRRVGGNTPESVCFTSDHTVWRCMRLSTFPKSKTRLLSIHPAPRVRYVPQSQPNFIFWFTIRDVKKNRKWDINISIALPSHTPQMTRWQCSSSQRRADSICFTTS